MKSTRPKLSLKILPNEPGGEGKPLVLIEGDRKTLEWFGNLILDHARDPRDCGLQFEAGIRVFEAKTEFGFYLHRLPCLDKIAKRKTPRKKAGVKAQQRIAAKRSS